MLKTYLSRHYFLLVNAYRSLDTIVPSISRTRPIVVKNFKTSKQCIHTSAYRLSTATNKDQFNESDDTSSDSESAATTGDEPRKFPCPDGSKLLRVALIGRPNAGKSTLINALMNLEVCPASMRPHTTRKAQRAIYLEEDTQIVFIDTPGVVNQKEIDKFNFSRDFALGPRKSIKNAHVVAVMHDVSHRLLRNKLDKKIITLLNNYPEKPAVLILNKVDLVVSKRRLLDILALLTNGMIGGKPIPIEQEKTPKQSDKCDTEDILTRATLKQLQKQKNDNEEHALDENSFTTRGGNSTQVEFSVPDENEHAKENDDPDVRGWPNFQEVFMMSSLNGDGIEPFKEYLIRQAKATSWDYPEEVLTNFSPHDLAILTLKSKILDYCEKDIPYKLTPVLEIWEENVRGDLTVVFSIVCETSRILKSLIGLKGTTISSISQETERSLMKLLRRHVSLHIKARSRDEKKEKSKN